MTFIRKSLKSVKKNDLCYIYLSFSANLQTQILNDDLIDHYRNLVETKTIFSTKYQTKVWKPQSEKMKNVAKKVLGTANESPELFFDCKPQ